MKNVKKTLLLALSFVLVAALSVVGTLAYLTSTDQDVNTMTYGNVHIAQHEYERANGELQQFTQGKPLYPVTGEKGTDSTVAITKPGTNGTMSVVTGLNNVQDKFVLVENTGINSAYVRTIVAYEMGSLDVARFETVIKTTHGSSWTENLVKGPVTIGDSQYYLVEYTYDGNNGILEPGKYTVDNSLGQVYMDSVGTNEDCEALDGNKNGTYDILVFSQAVQAEGFADAETAFAKAFNGATTTTNHPWLNESNVPVRVSTADDLKSALESEKSYVVLEKDVEVPGVLKVVGSKTLNLNGHNITRESGNAVIYVNDEDTELTITGNGTIKSQVNNALARIVVVQAGTVNINGGTLKHLVGKAVEVKGTGIVNINGGTLEAANQAVAAYGNGTINITDGLIKGTAAAVFVDENSKAYINGGTYESKPYEGRTFTLNKKDDNKNVVLEVRGGTFINYNPSDSDSENPHADFVAEGYKVSSTTIDENTTHYTVSAK